MTDDISVTERKLRPHSATDFFLFCHTFISSFIFSNVLSPIPDTFFISSTSLNRPFSSRYSIIFSAVTGPTPSSSCS